MRLLLPLWLAAASATAVHALMPSEIVAERFSNHSASALSVGHSNSSRHCAGPDPKFFCNRDDLCMPMALRCDGKNDCSDGEDEVGCKIKCDKAHLFACE